jgi:hypothetical protein
MDRYDEARHVRKQDEDRDRDRDDQAPQTTGSVLGLGGSPVPKMPGDPSASKEAAHGHHQTRTIEDETRLTGSDEVTQSPGATGIDMGAGGTGTQIDED